MPTVEIIHQLFFFPKVLKQFIIINNGNEIDCSLWNNGIYIVKIITDENEVLYKKIAIEK